jgi:hypothetical protein
VGRGRRKRVGGEEEDGGWGGGGGRRRRRRRGRRNRKRREENVPLHTNNSTTTILHFLELGLDRTLHFECMATRPADAEGVGFGREGEGVECEGGVTS